MSQSKVRTHGNHQFQTAITLYILQIGTSNKKHHISHVFRHKFLCIMIAVLSVDIQDTLFLTGQPGKKISHISARTRCPPLVQQR